MTKLKPLHKYEQTPMVEKTSELLMRIILMEKENPNFKIPSDVDPGFGYKVMKARLDAVNITVYQPLMVFLVDLCESPADVVLYAHSLHYIAVSKNKTHINIDDVCFAYANGFPNADQKQLAWDAQKSKDREYPGNLIDNFDNWGV